MKIRIYTNVIKDTNDRIQFPFGIGEFRSYIMRHIINSDQPYRHGVKTAMEGDIIVWAFKDENEKWYLIGEGFVKFREIGKQITSYYIEGARLYPRNIPLNELSFNEKAMECMFFGLTLEWDQYKEVLEKAIEPLAT